MYTSNIPANYLTNSGLFSMKIESFFKKEIINTRSSGFVRVASARASMLMIPRFLIFTSTDMSSDRFSNR